MLSTCIPYSRKYWRSLNLAVWPQTMFFTLFLDLNLAVWYGNGIRIHACRKKDWQILIWRFKGKPPNLIPRQIFRLYGMPTSWHVYQ